MLTFPNPDPIQSIQEKVEQQVIVWPDSVKRTEIYRLNATRSLLIWLRVANSNQEPTTSDNTTHHRLYFIPLLLDYVYLYSDFNRLRSCLHMRINLALKGPYIP